MHAGAGTARIRRCAAIGAIMLAVLALASPAAAKQRAYRVKVFVDHQRLWTYHHEQVGPECTTTTDGTGVDRAFFDPRWESFVLSGGGGTAGFSATIEHTRVGTRTHSTVGDPTCATGTSDEPTTDCGTKQSLAAFPTLTLVGKQLEFEWNGTAAVPEFGPCPFFAGSNEAQPGHEQPGQEYVDLVAPVKRGKLLAGKKRQTYFANVLISETETCATIADGCPEGVTYNSSVELKVGAAFEFKPKR